MQGLLGVLAIRFRAARRPHRFHPRPGMARSGIAALVLATASIAVACAAGEVTRVVDGRLVVGPFVSPSAYDAYLRGVLAEADGNVQAADAAFREALDEDEASPELWARSAALSCRLGRHAEADERFSRALELDASYEPAWRLRAYCLRSRGLGGEALVAAQNAARLDPDRLEGQLLVGTLLVALDRSAEGLRWFRGLVARWPNSAQVWRGVQLAASRAGDRGWQLAARRWVARAGAAAEVQALDELDAGRLEWSFGALSPGTGEGLPHKSSWAPVDAALRDGQLAQARRLARGLRINPRQLGPRAIVVGRPDLASEQSSLLLGADPDDTDSRMALALALDLAGAPAPLDALLTLPASAQPLSAVGQQLLTELLVRHIADIGQISELLSLPFGEDPATVAEAADERTAELLRQLRSRTAHAEPPTGESSPAVPATPAAQGSAGPRPTADGATAAPATLR